MMAYPQNTKSLAERAIIIHGLEKNDVASAIAQGRELQEAFDAPQNSERVLARVIQYHPNRTGPDLG
jgi:hypothetical protein